MDFGRYSGTAMQPRASARVLRQTRTQCSERERGREFRLSSA